ncbi:MAG: cytochrome c oxidase subunit II [Ancalomicrobiaceae bacterium]|nr:cytochrome c oxidase subunit II [Ancalomicrobiaceae bacterium]
MIPIEQGRNGTRAKAGRLTSYGLGLLATMAAVIVAALVPSPAEAEQIVPWQIWLQPANSEVMRDIHSFTTLTLWIVGLIVLLVMGLLIYVMVRFNAKANPVPSKVAHNTVIEVAWTVVPILILVIIAVPSLRLLYKELEIPAATVTVKAIGSNWKWSYEYSDLLDAHKDPVSFASNILDDKDRTDPVKQPRLLAADYNLVVPVGQVVHVLVTADAVSNIHSFAVPAFGIKVDAMPGRLNETWFKADNVGMYYGECSELCGQNHAFMPIAVQVVTADQYKVWSEAAKTNVDNANKTLASAIDADQTKAKLAAR